MKIMSILYLTQYLFRNNSHLFSGIEQKIQLLLIRNIKHLIGENNLC